MKRRTRHGLGIGTLLVMCAMATHAFAQTVPPEQAVTVSTVWSASAVHPGGTIALAVMLDIAPPYHVNANPPSDKDFIATVVAVTGGDDLAAGNVQYPAGHVQTLDYGLGAQELSVYAGKAIVYVPMSAKPQAAIGQRTVTVNVSWQACDEHACYQPDSRTVQVTLPVVATSEAVDQTNAELFAGFDPSGFTTIGQTKIAKPQAADTSGGGDTSGGAAFSFFGSSFTIDSSSAAGVAIILLLAAAAGFILNFTPCVLPVVPIKVLSLQKHAGDHARSLLLGLTFSLGIVACFAVLGMLAAGLISGIDQLQWGELFSYWWFSVPMGAIMFVMGLGMWGLFTTRLPQWVYQITPRNDTLAGSFGFGILTAVLSTPCTGPLFAGALVWALKQPAWLALSTFIAMGVGMALPYLILTARPKWIDKLPRTGPGSELIKQVMGLLLIAVAIYFFGFAGKGLWGTAHWYVVSAVVIGSMIYMVVRVMKITGRAAPRLATGVLALLIAGGMVMIATTATAKPLWTPYTSKIFKQAQEQGKTVVLEFTADWCFNCKVLEVAVLDKPQVIARLSDSDVAAIRVDLTSRSNTAGWAVLRDLGSTGIPMTAVYRPGEDTPIKLTSFYTPSALLDAIGRTE